jgi:TRAP-type C4-dicarboxylate transport system substrate-binding protein
MLTRRDLGAAALASVALGGRSPFAFAQGAKHSLKLGGQFQASHPASVAMDEACAEIRKESNGEIDIHFFPNAQLGSDAAMLQQVRQGVLDMMPASGIAMQVPAPVPGLAASPLPFQITPRFGRPLTETSGQKFEPGSKRLGSSAFRNASTAAIGT